MRRSSGLGEAAPLFLCACAGSAPSPSAPGPGSPSIVQMTNEPHLTAPGETKVAYMPGSDARRRGAERWLM